MASSALKAIARIVFARSQTEGGGFLVHRALGGRELSELDPFLMLDHMGPMTYGPGEALGAPDHPHRGFETVTYILKGGLQHLDSHGNCGNLTDGWVQWMTAGSGVVHSEMPNDDIRKNGGTLEGFQLWVNLPAKDKMSPPRYQDTPADKIPLITVKDNPSVQLKVIAGRAEGVTGPIETRFPVVFYDIRLLPGAKPFSLNLSRQFQGFVYAYGGDGVVLVGPEATPIRQFYMGVLNPDYLAKAQASADSSDEVPVTFSLQDPSKESRFLVVAGEPIHEEVARYGPFVMNTEEEIMKAIRDFQSGKMGSIDGEAERYIQ
ncbi:Pirin-like protein [Dimargaris cristalligena]|uniref:Pirin-like protein n=1 Tax=Dimargaris cristalligena TaxID=215637 RepID=A0A4P9ZRV0_9FUNG|nr:Pirin-like protein [Dimargaris cristalligena]|eukprot:RKP36105.1 Pirin-like protein [Dimargaris cristalligena]